MRPTALLIASSLAIAGCAERPPAPKPEESTSSIAQKSSTPQARWFYGRPEPTVSAAISFKEWQDCIRAAAMRLDDYTSSVMDIASAIQPVCSAKEDVTVDAINKEYLEKNAGIAANMTLTEMIRVRQSTHNTMTQTIGTQILTMRKDRKALAAKR